MRKTTIAFLACAALGAGALPARADLLIKVDQSTQRMTVDRDGERLYEWPVSTGKPGYETPRGVFKPNRMEADHYSQEYDNAPMPYAIFFDLKGHAIHGSFDPIGKPAASHGCVRLSPANAATLFELVREEKMARTRVEIAGDVQIALRNYKPAAKTRSASRERRYQRREAYGADIPPGYYVREPLPGAPGLFGFY